MSTNASFGVPLFEFVGERDTLRRWAQPKGEEGLRKYWAECNQFSIDGKPTSIFGNDTSMDRSMGRDHGIV
jgi:hypothetical protein